MRGAASGYALAMASAKAYGNLDQGWDDRHTLGGVKNITRYPFVRRSHDLRQDCCGGVQALFNVGFVVILRPCHGAEHEQDGSEREQYILANFLFAAFLHRGLILREIDVILIMP